MTPSIEPQVTPNRIGRLIQVLLSIVLFMGILQLLLEDLSLVARWPWSLRSILVISALGIDSILTLEFGILFGKSLVKKRFFAYFFHEYGWIDFISSLPLLVFDSGPRFLAVTAGVAISGSAIGIFGLFRILRFVRIIRLLRLTRLLKATERISTQKPLTQTPGNKERISSNTTKLTLLILIGILLSSVLFTFLVELTGFRGTQPALEAHYNGIIQDLSSRDLLNPSHQTFAQSIGSMNPGILGIAQRGRVIYGKETATYRNRQYGVLDYVYVHIPETETEFYISTLDFQADDALMSLQLFIIALVLIQLVYFFGPKSHDSMG